MMATWSDSDPSSSENEPEMEIKANLSLMEMKDEVCIDDFDDFDKLQNEYECLFNDFEKLRHRCKDYKKITTTLTLDIEKTKLDYDVVMDNKNELEKCFDNLKSENEAFRLELEEKSKALGNCLNENAALKISKNRNEKHVNHMHANRSPRKKHAHISCYECGRKGHIAFYCSFNVKHPFVKKIWVPKGSHILTNSQGPIKIWVPKSSACTHLLL